MNDDLISREALKKAIKDVEYNYDGYEPCDLGRFMDKVDELIDNAPTVLHDNYIVCSEKMNDDLAIMELKDIRDYLIECHYNVEAIDYAIKVLESRKDNSV